MSTDAHTDTKAIEHLDFPVQCECTYKVRGRCANEATWVLNNNCGCATASPSCVKCKDLILSVGGWHCSHCERPVHPSAHLLGAA